MRSIKWWKCTCPMPINTFFAIVIEDLCSHYCMIEGDRILLKDEKKFEFLTAVAPIEIQVFFCARKPNLKSAVRSLKEIQQRPHSTRCIIFFERHTIHKEVAVVAAPSRSLISPRFRYILSTETNPLRATKWGSHLCLWYLQCQATIFPLFII